MKNSSRQPPPRPVRTGLALVGTALALLSLGGPGGAKESCTTLLQGRCQKCHYLTRVCDKVADNKGKWSWKRTVKNMVALGAKLEDAEQDALVDCLSQPSPEVNKICASEK